MTQSEYEAKKRECWEEYCRTHKTLINGDDTYLIEYEAFDYAFDRAYALGKQEKDAEKSKEKLMCLRDRTKVCNRRHACDIDTDAWHSMYSR